MGLLQKAVETYDAMAYRAGKIFDGEKEPLAPISHITTQADIEITLDQDGNFVTARLVDSNAPNIIIPVTEKSMGRTSKAAAERPHPLCDKIKYLLPYNKTEYNCYISQLSDWASSKYSTPKLLAVLSYIQKGTILMDLSETGVLLSEPNSKTVKEDLMICWVVIGLGESLNGPCWTDLKLMKSFSDYYAEKKASSGLCMISGQIAGLAEQHIKGVVAKHGNAKLISSNDKTGFTYRGRFSDDWQAATVSYVSSQKAHNALRWLVSNQGVTFDDRTFLCWNPQGNKLPSITGSMGRKSGSSQRTANPTEYRQQLMEALSGWKNSLPVSAGVVITAFDAATKGRLSITYFNELMASDFLQRLYDWEETCIWDNGVYGIQSPYLFQIVKLAFGTPRNGKMEIDERILSQQMQRLVACRVDKAPFPLDIERALVGRASNLQNLSEETEDISKKTKKKIKIFPRAELLFTACAAIRKFHYDNLKEEWDMALDEKCSDRSYLFGRLLAVADALENSTYSDEDKRETNAMRMQKAFTLHPLATWRTLWDKLRPYAKRLAQSKPRLYKYYQKTIDEIMGRFSPFDSTLNQRLDDIYLLGYSHQRAYRTEKPDRPETEA